jgi:hypothetical protein
MSAILRRDARNLRGYELFLLQAAPEGAGLSQLEGSENRRYSGGVRLHLVDGTYELFRAH